jgi:hypothetical protein
MEQDYESPTLNPSMYYRKYKPLVDSRHPSVERALLEKAGQTAPEKPSLRKASNVLAC